MRHDTEDTLRPRCQVPDKPMAQKNKCYPRTGLDRPRGLRVAPLPWGSRQRTGGVLRECPLAARRAAMATLNALAARDQSPRDGHVYAHAIGIAAGRAGHADVASVFASCSEIFQAACYPA